MVAVLIGSYTIGDDYGGLYRLPDGTEANVVTRITGPGLGSETEIEADRKLTDDEEDALLNADATTDHAQPPLANYRGMPTQARY